jgi:hypothetical protein
LLLSFSNSSKGGPTSTRHVKACILQRGVACHYNTSYCIGQCTTVIRTVVLTSQVHKELVYATDVYVLALCSLQQQVIHHIHHNYGILKLLTCCVRREGDNSLKCNYNHRGVSFNGKFMGNRASSAVTINKCNEWQCTCYISIVNSVTTQKCITAVLHNTVGDVTSVNHNN